MANTKPLVIDVQSRSIPNGIENQWNDLTGQIKKFTHDIKTPALEEDSDISALVSGIPTVFARANMFKLALDSNDGIQEDTSSALNTYYENLVDEWRGIIACIALDSPKLDIRTINMGYTDGRDISETANLYEPKGAFGNMLFLRREVWSPRKRSENETTIPFIHVIKIGDQVVAGTSPDSLLFTSSSYKLQPGAPYVDIKTGKFTDPQKSEMSQGKWLSLYAYVENLKNRISLFVDYYTPEGSHESLVSLKSVSANLDRWLSELRKNIRDKGYDIEKASALPVSQFKEPFSLVLNYSDEMYGINGQIWSLDVGRCIKFDPKDLLLKAENSEIAIIPLSGKYVTDPTKLAELSIYTLKAKKLGGGYAFFALPLSETGLRVFGQNIGVLLGQEIVASSRIKSSLNAEYDERKNTLRVKLTIVSEEGKTKPIEVEYKVSPDIMRDKDLLIWPNFISNQWDRYFLYSEMPHNVPPSPFSAVPFVGNCDEDFEIIVDSKNKIFYLAEEGKIKEDDPNPNDKREPIDAKLHVTTNLRDTSNYKYEIYESNVPFKGVLLKKINKDSGFILIRYSNSQDDTLNMNQRRHRMPLNVIGKSYELHKACLGVDFGSTNTSVAYYDKDDNTKSKAEGFIFKDLRVSLLCDNHRDPEVPPIENRLFFFQGNELKSNSIKSFLTLHDSKKLQMGDNQLDKEVSGGFPCFSNDLPISSITDDEINITFPTPSGTQATLIYNMKWRDLDTDKAHKKAFLKSLLLQVYAQLFTQEVVPTNLKWSYPSSMGANQVTKYDQIWGDLASIDNKKPVLDRNGQRYSLTISQGNKQTTKNKQFGGGIGNSGSSSGNGGSGSSGFGSSASFGSRFGSSVNSGFGSSENSGFGSSGNGGFGSGGFGSSGNSGFGGGSVSGSKYEAPDLKPDNDDPIQIKWINVDSAKSLTEACAAAYFLADKVNRDKLTLSFDVGGSTTDISAICSINGMQTMIKQSSIRFAAQRVANATRNLSSSFKKVLDEITRRYGIQIQGLNKGTPTYSAETAPYFFEQIVDKLAPNQLVDFYKNISANCPDLFCVNLYVTGLITFYAGQIARKLVKEVRRISDANLGPNWKPKVEIKFAGKGSRIFEWYRCTNRQAADEYNYHMFIYGLGGEQEANDFLVPPLKFDIPDRPSDENKYEVSKGLAISDSPSTDLRISGDDKVIEILGEEGFTLYTRSGDRVPLSFDNSITSDYMRSIGDCFLGPTNECNRFMLFAEIFQFYARKLYNLDSKLTDNDFINAIKSMDITTYIQSLPEYRAAREADANTNDGSIFDFVAPIIILEGMKFYDEVLYPKLRD